MRSFAARLAGFVVVLLGISFLVQAVVLLTPGDPILALAGENLRPEDRARMEKALGLDRPFHERWIGSLAGLARGDLGRSFKDRDVAGEIRTALPKTMLLATVAMAISAILGLVWGALSVRVPGGAVDRVSLITAVACVSTPIFVMGLLLRFVLSDRLHLLPAGGYADFFPSDGGGTFDPWAGLALILPAATLGTRSAAYFARLARATLLDLATEPFLRTARAKGRGEAAVFFLHHLPAAAPPLVSILFLDFASLLTGSVITETIFAWPGMGRLALSAVLERDLPLLQGVVLVMAVVYATMGLAADLTRAWLDPRLR